MTQVYTDPSCETLQYWVHMKNNWTRSFSQIFALRKNYGLVCIYTLPNKEYLTLAHAFL